MTDILFDKNGDLLFINGDIQYGRSNQQHQRDILIARPGDYKTALPLGVGINDYLKDDDPNAMLSSIKQHFNKDGMVMKQLSYYPDENKLIINAIYNGDSNSN